MQKDSCISTVLICDPYWRHLKHAKSTKSKAIIVNSSITSQNLSKALRTGGCVKCKLCKKFLAKWWRQGRRSGEEFFSPTCLSTWQSKRSCTVYSRWCKWKRDFWLVDVFPTFKTSTSELIMPQGFVKCVHYADVVKHISHVLQNRSIHTLWGCVILQVIHTRRLQFTHPQVNRAYILNIYKHSARMSNAISCLWFLCWVWTSDMLMKVPTFTIEWWNSTQQSSRADSMSDLGFLVNNLNAECSCKSTFSLFSRFQLQVRLPGSGFQVVAHSSRAR